MELSRRGVLAGVGVAGGVGAVGFVGAVAVTEDGSAGASDGADGTDDDGSVPVDADAPFEALLVATDDTEAAVGDDGAADAPHLFDASDLDRVQIAATAAESDDDGPHLVYVSLSTDGREAFRDRLEVTGVTTDPDSFAVSMTLDGAEVRHVELDEPTADALTDDEWNGVLELPFESAVVAADVYDALAAV